MLGLIESRNVDGMRRTHATRACDVAIPLLAGIGCVVAAAPAAAEIWRLSASASATETYTSNANYSAQSLAESDFVTSIGGALQISGVGARLKLDGSIAGTALFYAKESQNNSFAPNVNLSANLEAIEKFAYVDAWAFVSQTFISPFGAQPGDLVNASQNRYTQQTYAVSPYIKGVLGSTNISYQLRDENIWTVASSFGNSSANVPSTYSNNLTGSMSGPVYLGSWNLEYNRYYYESGIKDVAAVGQGAATTDQFARFFVIYPYQIDSQLQISPRVGYEWNDFSLQGTQGATFDPQALTYGIGGQWSPTNRTQVGGFWEHRFFGSSYSAQISHRLPNAALSASLSRGLSSYPQLALAIPAGATVAQVVNAAFATRIPDPAERAVAIEQFFARTGLPPTLASPVSFYAASVTVQELATVSLVLIGALNSVTFSLFRSKTEAISEAGNVLPPALQFGENNTQTGGGVSFSHRLSAFTNLGASATYSTTTVNTSAGPFAGARSNNGNASLNLNTRFGPKTGGSAGVSYSQSRFTGGIGPETTSALNVFASVNHTF